MYNCTRYSQNMPHILKVIHLIFREKIRKLRNQSNQHMFKYVMDLLNNITQTLLSKQKE